MKSLIFLLALTTIYSQWIIHFPKEGTQQATVNLIKGRFVKIPLKLTKVTPETTNDATILKLEDQVQINIAKKFNLIDPKETTTPHIHLGLPCNSIYDEGQEVELRFTVSTINYNVPILKVRITKGEIKQGKFYQTSTFVGVGTYGNLMVNTHDLMNFDPIQLTFESARGDVKFAEVKPMTIPQFNGDDEAFPTVKTKYILRGEPEQDDQEFNVKVDNACFSFPSKFSFKRAWEIKPNAQDLVIPIIKSSNMTYEDMMTGMNIQMNYAIYPIEQFCVAQDTRDAFITDDALLSMSFTEHPTKLRYDSMFISSRGIGVTRFTGLSHFIPYKMKCIFQTALIDSSRVTLTFGYSPDTDIKINLETDEIVPTASQCITWTLRVPQGKEYDVSLFEVDMLDYCYDFFTDYSIPRKDNGCLECVSRNANEVYKKKDDEALYSMCIKSKDNCESFYSQSISKKANELKETLTTKAAISKSIGIEFPYEVVAINTENDDTAPDINLITVHNFVIKAERVEFQLVTQEQKPLECFILARQRSTVYLSPYEFELNKIYIPDYKTPQQTFVHYFPNSEWDERLYNFIVLCYNIPFFDGNYKHTPATVKLQFLKSKSVPNPIREKLILPRDCNKEENQLTAECMKRSHHSFMKFEAKIGQIDNAQAIKEFFNEQPHRREQILQGHVTDLQTIHTTLGKFNAAIMINDLMEMTNCQTAIRFDTCRKIEKRVQEEVIDVLYELLGGENIIDNLMQDVVESEKENQIKRAVMTVFAVINNSNAFNIATTKKLLKIMKNIYDHYDKLMVLIKDDKIKNDVVKIIAQYLSNFSDIITYNEVDVLYEEINKDTQLNGDKDVLTYLELVGNYTSKLVKSNVESVLDLDKMTFKVVQLSQPSGNPPELKGEYNFANHLNFTFDVFAKDEIRVHIPDRVLYTQFNVRKIAFVFYEDFYPLVSYKHQRTNKIKAILIKAYDKDNKEVTVKGLTEINRIGITFKPDNRQKFCYYHDKGAKFKNVDLLTVDRTKSDNELLCVAGQLSEFSSGLFDIGKSGDDEDPDKDKDKGGFPSWGYYLVGGIAIILVIGGIGAGVYFVLYKKKVERGNSMTADIPNEALLNE